MSWLLEHTTELLVYALIGYAAYTLGAMRRSLRHMRRRLRRIERSVLRRVRSVQNGSAKMPEEAREENHA